MAVYHQPGNYLEVAPGVEIYYEDRGSGMPLIFIPGFTFTTEVFVHQMEHFSKTHRVILFDPRSQGRSTVTPHGNDYATHAADLAKLIKALDLKDIVLIGWSFGCLESWGYVQQEGTAALKAVVSVDLSPKPLSEDPTTLVEGPLDEMGGAYNACLQSPQGQRDFVADYAQQVMVQRELSDAELAWIVEQSLHTPYYIASLLFASGMFTDHMAEAQLVAATLPALEIIAEHWAETAEPFIHKHCPHTKTAVLGGHMMFWEHPEKFNKILEEFLELL